ncbi:NUMOD3 domain-containing DNA-binding protein [Bacteroides sp. 224]|uniref:NUMOD3 domain-containing DNA-binding protein n=1 Tax=Bacteroides sp. 224 TaxID=2302936 RepID=UPI0013D0CA0D|nr:NUMOD3 domain-containing DNA-binding protein [Bacteroides sp. 224]NDV66402.1 hypothetical protein [Bacteroides sp. 224]
MKQTKRGVMKSGSLNPMWGKKQSDETKRKISDSQKKRYEIIRQALQVEDTTVKKSVGRTDKAARMDLLNQCLHRDTIAFDSVEQAHNFVAIMLQNEDSYLKKVIKEEINRFINDRNRHAQ